MPLYEFECADCGLFALPRTVPERDAPAACPECEAPAPRILSAPNLAVMPGSLRQAHFRNERSRHEPRAGGPHHCSTGCGCAGGAKPRSISVEGKRQESQRSRKGKRPWMLGH